MAAINDISGAAQKALAQGQGGTAAAQTGKLLGEAVSQVASPQSQVKGMERQLSLTDLHKTQYEESGQYRSAERGGKEADKHRRSLSSTIKPQVERIEQIREAQDAMERLPDVRARKAEVERLAGLISERQSRGDGFDDPEAFLEFILQTWTDVRGQTPGAPGDDAPDATEHYGVLAHLGTLFGAGQDALRSLAEAATDLLASEHGVEISKGLVISETAAVYVSETTGTAPQLRLLYNEQVTEHGGILKSFRDIMGKYGPEGFAKAVEYLIVAAGQDMAALSSSSDKKQLKVTVDNLYQLEVLNTVHDRTGESLARLRIRYELKAEATPLFVMEGVFEMVETPHLASEAKVTAMAEAVVVASLPGRISFLRELRNNIVAMIPFKVFDPEDMDRAINLRNQLIDLAKGAQDAADEEEQTRLEEQGQ